MISGKPSPSRSARAGVPKLKGWPSTLNTPFVVGFASVYAALGVAAGGIGSSLDGVQTWVERVGGVLVILMGLLLLGVLKGRMATAEVRPITRLPGGPVLRPFVLGVGFGSAV